MGFSFILIAILAILNVEAMPVAKRNVNKKNVAEVITPFGVKLFKNISKYEDSNGNVEPNFVYSPLAVTRALAMLRDTVPGPPRQQLGASMGLDQFIGSTAHAIRGLINHVTKKDEALTTSSVQVANKFFFNEKLPVDKSHMKYVARKHDSMATIVKTETMQRELTSWFNDDAEQPMLTENANLMMLNDVNFKGFWENGFKLEKTKLQDFFDEENNAFKVPMMTQKGSYFYSKQCVIDAWSIFDWGLDCTFDPQPNVLEIPFGNNSLSMMFIISNDDYPLSNIIENIDTDLSNWRTNTEQSSCEIHLPKLNIDFKTELSTVLKKNKVVSSEETSNLKDEYRGQNVLTDFYHRTTLSLNEEGHMEKVVKKKSAFELLFPFFDMEPQIIYREIKVNRPFVFTIEDKLNGAILLMGKVTNPILL